ncbi:MAG: hypothetical protein NG747_16300 [Candidatus Brocadia sp.]|nr:hypothetical protein [Candidatus Brocadia sp.]
MIKKGILQLGLFEEKLRKLKLEAWVQIKDEAGILKIESDEEAFKEESYLDGCYVIETNLKECEADTDLVHAGTRTWLKWRRCFKGARRWILRFVPCTQDKRRVREGMYLW